jgi:hypothetical protein
MAVVIAGVECVFRPHRDPTGLDGLDCPPGPPSLQFLFSFLSPGAGRLLNRPNPWNNFHRAKMATSKFFNDEAVSRT